MEMPMYTLGPWRVGDAGFTVFGPPNGKPSAETVATVQKKANSRLIAAAPELLQALKAVQHTLPFNPQPRTDTEALQLAIYRKVVAAIAKAEGRS